MGVAFLQIDVVFSRLQLDYCRSAQLYSDYSDYSGYSHYGHYSHYSRCSLPQALCSTAVDPVVY